MPCGTAGRSHLGSAWPDTGVSRATAKGHCPSVVLVVMLEVMLMPDPVPQKKGGILSCHILGLFLGLRDLPPVL